MKELVSRTIFPVKNGPGTIFPEKNGPPIFVTGQSSS